MQLGIDVSHPGHLRRVVGPVPVGDFFAKPPQGAAFIMRGSNRQAILSTQLRKGRTLEGLVLNSDGTPAVGAQVRAATKYQAYSWKFHSPHDYSVVDSVTTDERGKFSIFADKQTSMTITHAGHAPLLIRDYDNRVPMPWSRPGSFQLAKGTRIRGRVLDSAGQPIPRAIVTARLDAAWNEFDMPLSLARTAAAGEDGRYELPPLPAGVFKLIVNSQLTPESDIKFFNLGSRKNPTQFGIRSQDAEKRYEIVPIDYVFTSAELGVDATDETLTMPLVAQPVVKLDVQIEFPDSVPASDRPTDIGIVGLFRDQEWNGRYVTADENGAATLLAPKGLEFARIKTGVAMHKRTADGETEIGHAVHLGTLDKDVDGVIVLKRDIAKLEVQLNLKGNVGKRGRISIAAQYVRQGYRENSPDKTLLYVHGSTQSGENNYRAIAALPDEPILLKVTQKVAGARVLLHEQEVTLKPNETRKYVLDIQPIPDPK